jgi:hypothetical protein
MGRIILIKILPYDILPLKPYAVEEISNKNTNVSVQQGS